MDILQIIRKRRPNVRNIIIDYGHKKIQNIGNVPNKELVINSWYNYYSGFLDNANNENDIRDVLAILLPLTRQEESDIFVMHHTDEEIYDILCKYRRDKVIAASMNYVRGYDMFQECKRMKLCGIINRTLLENEPLSITEMM